MKIKHKKTIFLMLVLMTFCSFISAQDYKYIDIHEEGKVLKSSEVKINEFNISLNKLANYVQVDNAYTYVIDFSEYRNGSGAEMTELRIKEGNSLAEIYGKTVKFNKPGKVVIAIASVFDKMLQIEELCIVHSNYEGHLKYKGKKMPLNIELKEEDLNENLSFINENKFTNFKWYVYVANQKVYLHNENEDSKQITLAKLYKKAKELNLLHDNELKRLSASVSDGSQNRDHNNNPLNESTDFVSIKFNIKPISSLSSMSKNLEQ